MLTTCPECGGNVSDRASACPHCGYPLRTAAEGPFSAPGPGREIEMPEECPKRRKKETLLHSVLSVSSALLILILLVLGIFTGLVACDAGGMGSALRTMAERDAGDGSRGDDSGSRIAFQYYLLQYLNLVQGVSSDLPERKDRLSDRKEDPDVSAVSERRERVVKPLPPPPPEKEETKEASPVSNSPVPQGEGKDGQTSHRVRPDAAGLPLRPNEK